MDACRPPGFFRNEKVPSQVKVQSVQYDILIPEFLIRRLTHLIPPPANEGFQIWQGKRGDGENDGDAADDAGDDQELAHGDHYDLWRGRRRGHCNLNAQTSNLLLKAELQLIASNHVVNQLHFRIVVTLTYLFLPDSVKYNPVDDEKCHVPR